MDCPTCHQPLREGAQFCAYCGSRTAHGGEQGEESVPTVERVEMADPTPTIVIEDPLVGRVLDGKYEIISQLGAGGMGAVYRARRVLIGDEVAVKVLHSKFTGDETLVERFRREARAAAQLHHPNVVTIHDYGESRGRNAFAYIVMELVRGDSLRDLLRREGKLETARAAALMRDVCAGVGAAHRRGIVHRDIKPDNIIVVPADEDSATERVKVVDFGIAKLRDMAHDGTLTEEGAMVGTPFYMSPEQCKGEPLDARADVYSLGALLYEMLAGEPPFVALSLTGIILKHINEPPPPMPQGLQVPAALRAAVARSLSKDPEARQRDATEFARDIQSATTAPPAPTAQQPSANELTPTPATIFDGRTRPAPVTPTPVTPTPAQTTPASPASPAQPAPSAPGSKLRARLRSAAVARKSAAQVPPPQTHGAARQQTFDAQPLQTFDAQPRRSRAPLLIALLVVLLFGIGGLAAVGLILLTQRGGSEVKSNSNANARPTATPAASNANATRNANTPGGAYANRAANMQANANVPANANANVPANMNAGPATDERMRRAEQKILADELLSDEDLRGLSGEQLRALRNTTYARHGRAFQRPDLQDYFLGRPWYRPRPDFSEKMLTANDRANAELIKSFE